MSAAMSDLGMRAGWQWCKSYGLRQLKNWMEMEIIQKSSSTAHGLQNLNDENQEHGYAGTQRQLYLTF